MYKEETEDGYALVDHKGDIVTETPSASQIEVASELESWSPVSLEKAVIARFVTGEFAEYRAIDDWEIYSSNVLICTNS